MKGKIIALSMEAGPGYFSLVMNIFREGGIVFPLAPQMPPAALFSTLDYFAADSLITDQQKFLDHPQHSIKVVRASSLESEEEDRSPATSLPLPWQEEREAALFLTSGSTGAPKGVLHTLSSLYHSALGTLEFYSFRPGDRWLLNLPLNHVGGFLIMLRTHLGQGKCVYPDPANPKDWIGTIIKQRPHFLSLVPAQLGELFIASDSERGQELGPIVRSMKAILLGGAPLPEWMWQKAMELGWPLSPTYGSSETGSQVTALLPLSSEQLSSGVTLPYRELAVNQETAAISIGGKTVFTAYLEGTKRIDPFNEQGHFLTSDLGHLDEAGNLHLHGRSDQVFISGGENINPFTIEAVLKSFPGVVEAIVVPAPHPKFQEVPVAFLEWGKEENIDLEGLKKHLRSKLAPFSIPKYLVDIKTVYNKVGLKYSRQKLRELAPSCLEFRQ